jgi:hypothetical protein
MPSQPFCNISYINGLEGDRSSQEQIDRVRPAAFIIHETSPGNGEVPQAILGEMEFPEPESEQASRQSWASSPQRFNLDNEGKGLKKYWIKHEDSIKIPPCP